MENTSEPFSLIENWQKWYKEHAIVASMDEPLITKKSREKLHDTSNACASLITEIEKQSMKKATAYFADTITEFSGDLSGLQLFDCLLSAAIDNYNYTKKEYDNAKQFLDSLKNKTNDYPQENIPGMGM